MSTSGKPRRVYLLFYFIRRRWQNDGEWWARLADAKAQGDANEDTFGWHYRIVPVDVKYGRKKR